MTSVLYDNNYYSQDELQKLGFRSFGRDIFISRKSCIYGAESMTLGDNIRIDDHVILAGKIELGSHIHLGANSYISGGSDGIVFEDFSGVAYYYYVTTSSSVDYLGLSLGALVIPSPYRLETCASIVIRRFSSVGAYSMIMPGVELAEGTTVGAFTFMKCSSKSLTIYSGNPATSIASKSKRLIVKAEAFLNEYNNKIK
jgi:acetyltransferase-like isoleucine patch superfamily enzyme